MNQNYEFNSIESKWRKRWEENPVNPTNTDKKKYYCLDMFPYPSASGVHVGHWRGYVLSDVVSRYKILQGYEVLHPMGWDAFGLPAENYAIKVKQHPSKVTAESIENFRRQLKEISAVYNWDNEVNTTDPKFYKWTQWIFIKMFENGLAYEKEMPLNWCPSCKAVLANEEATNGTCDRCGETVTKKNLRQWMLKITEYAERLLNDLDDLDWPEKVKKMQKEWIGKSFGAEIDFKIDGSDKELKVFTTRPDTLYGSTFMVIAPEHPIALDITIESQKTAVEKYIFDASTKSSVDRMADKEKTGIFTGSYGINPLNNEKLPIYISDYVLIDYGTGAIMCVPAHDERDFEFAKKFGLKITQVIKAKDSEEGELLEAFTDSGVMINSGEFNGINSEEAKNIIPDYLEKQGIGKKTTNYKLRDWVFSRQRYWGEPIPLVHCDCCGTVPVKMEDLPVLLPNVESYEPTETGESPLASIEEFVNTTCPKCGKPAKRETNTMPQWAGSSWYFLRYADVNNDKELVSKEAMERWLPVDMYVGGVEHAVLHLLYARFYTKFLYDIGAVSFEEPFKRLFNQGMITKDGAKMSKSKGNVVSPDDVTTKYGTDALRLYELFVGPPELDAEWDDRGIEGIYRFLNKFYKLIATNNFVSPTKDHEVLRNKLIHSITLKLENLNLNTVASTFMEFTNTYQSMIKDGIGIDKQSAMDMVILISPFAPHIAEELWEILGNNESVFKQTFPSYDETKLVSDIVTIVVQENGKLRANIQVEKDADKDTVLSMAKEAIKDKIEGKEIVKEIFVPNKIVNIVVKG